MTLLRDPIFRRLLPLYCAIFFITLIFWYAIEKIFMYQLGFSASLIGITIGVYLAISLILEFPMGVLADRWSRRNVFIIGCASLAVASLIGALSDSVVQYFLIMAPYGAYYAITSGLDEAIIYDTLLEAKKTKLYKKYYGYALITVGASLMLASLLSSPIVALWGLRATYWLSLISCILAIICLLAFKEPSIHKNTTLPAQKFFTQTLRTITELTTHRVALIAAIGSLMFNIVNTHIGEFYQLWLSALGTPETLYGILTATLSIGFIVAGFVTNFFNSAKSRIAASLLSLLCIIILSTVQILWVVVASALVGSIFLLALSAAASHIVHDHVASSMRSGVSSLINTVSTLVIIPISCIFGVVIDVSNIFMASWILVPFVIFGGVLLSRVKSKTSDNMSLNT